MNKPAQSIDVSASSPSFTAIYRDQLRYVWRLVRQLGVAERELEDVVHDVFVTVHRQLPQYDATRPIRPWLAGITFRVASTHRRRASTQREIAAQPMVDELAQNLQGAEDELQQREARRIMLELLERLEPDRRAVFVLHELGELSMPEVAEAIDAPLNTLYSRLRLARRQFAAEVRRLQQSKERTP